MDNSQNLGAGTGTNTSPLDCPYPKGTRIYANSDDIGIYMPTKYDGSVVGDFGDGVLNNLAKTVGSFLLFNKDVDWTVAPNSYDQWQEVKSNRDTPIFSKGDFIAVSNGKAFMIGSESFLQVTWQHAFNEHAGQSDKTEIIANALVKIQEITDDKDILVHALKKAKTTPDNGIVNTTTKEGTPAPKTNRIYVVIVIIIVVAGTVIYFISKKGAKHT